jgi:hypothetical protein
MDRLLAALRARGAPHRAPRARARGDEAEKPRRNPAGAIRPAGAAVIHAPSGCMAAYEGTPARRRAQAAPPAAAAPAGIDEWQYNSAGEPLGTGGGPRAVQVGSGPHCRFAVPRIHVNVARFAERFGGSLCFGNDDATERHVCAPQGLNAESAGAAGG